MKFKRCSDLEIFFKKLIQIASSLAVPFQRQAFFVQNKQGLFSVTAMDYRIIFLEHSEPSLCLLQIITYICITQPLCLASWTENAATGKAWALLELWIEEPAPLRTDTTAQKRRCPEVYRGKMKSIK